MTKKQSGQAAATAFQSAINEVMPKLIDALDGATAGVTLAIVESINAVKIGVHTGYLVEYLNARKWQDIGWELGAISYDVTQAFEGESSVTIDGETFDFIAVKPEQQRRLASISDSTPNSRNTSILSGPNAFKLYIEGILSQVDFTFRMQHFDMECIN